MTESAFAFLDSDSDRAWTPTFPVVREQQRELRESLREGFPDRQSILLWQHAVAAASAGQVPDEWHTSIITDRWTSAALLGDPDLRRSLTPHPPTAEEREGVRQDIVEHDLIPAFRSALGVFREQATDWTDSDGFDTGGRQRFLGLRPRLHQLATAQHSALRRALAYDDREALRTREAVADWLETVVFSTAGFTPEGFDRAVVAPFGEWRPALREPGPYLEAMLAEDVLPPMNKALRDAARRSVEMAKTRKRSSRTVPRG